MISYSGLIETLDLLLVSILFSLNLSVNLFFMSKGKGLLKQVTSKSFNQMSNTNGTLKTTIQLWCREETLFTRMVFNTISDPTFWNSIIWSLYEL